MDLSQSLTASPELHTVPADPGTAWVKDAAVALDAAPDTIARGSDLYAAHCWACHGQGAVARFGGSVPDLRYANEDTHVTWHGIVVGGARAANGMPAIEITVDESEAIRNYILSLSEAIREGR